LWPGAIPFETNARQRRRPLTITIEPSFAAAWLVSRLDRFKAANPEVDVPIASTMRIVELDREAIDIGIRYAMEVGGPLVHHRLFDDETLAVRSPRLAAGPPALTTLRDLERVTPTHMEFGHMPWVRVASHWFDWENWLAAVGADGIDSSHGIRFNDDTLAVQAAIAGQGMVLGCPPMVRDALVSRLLVALSPSGRVSTPATTS
jgi:LysR family glycine cleavage system transcriptional activator